MVESLKSDICGEIIIGKKAIGYLNQILDEINPYKIGVVTSRSVADLWMKILLENAKRDFSQVFILPDGEEVKSLETVTDLWRGLISSKFTRKSLLISFGGGAICDVTGFVASTYMRGIGLINIPTTLLSQVDAAIGGKTGIDFEGKNIIGTFYLPNAVIVDPIFLKTLPDDEFRSGMAEIVKYGIINGSNLLEKIENNLDRILARDSEILEKIIQDCVRIKVSIVERDLKEKGLRMILNLGHTVGHAIEKLSNYRIKHGWAVSIGLVVSCKIAEKIFNFKDTQRIVRLLQKLNLPIAHEYDPVKIVQAMKIDKKAWYGEIMFVLPKRIGEIVVQRVPEETILRCLNETRKTLSSS